MLFNVLRAYAAHNPEVGYCQGFNFIVGRLLRIMSEEEAFWMLSSLLESFLPLDYYCKMMGVILDHNILSDSNGGVAENRSRRLSIFSSRPTNRER